MSTAIKVEGLSKAYQLGQIGTGTISRDLERWWASLRGKEDPFLKIGEENDRTLTSESNVVWSLKDINFEVEQGDALGIIGRNGAGKSTLLKILSRVTLPTAGTIKAKGRIASLLEVGTGFHPELTGRENIYLNGAILGMRKKEIIRKLDEIIDFSGVEKYIDTPVKRYSSGMYVRLAFAVAAHLDSEILIVDEVLAVGDAEFQKKCLGKMGEVSKGEGRTVLFVSHNMASISSLCNKAMLLNHGRLASIDNVSSILSEYFSFITKSSSGIFEKIEDDVLTIEHYRLLNENMEDCLVFKTTEKILVSIAVDLKKATRGLRIGFDVLNSKQEIIFRSFHDDKETGLLSPGKLNLLAEIPSNLLMEENYFISLQIGIHNQRWITNEQVYLNIDVRNLDGVNVAYRDFRPGFVSPDIKWQVNDLLKKNVSA